MKENLYTLEHERWLINLFYTKTRYPDDCSYIPDIAIAIEAVENAEYILDFVSSKIL